MAEETLLRLHAFVEGIVQGVGFRYFVQDQAVRLGLKGWVRNRWDGSVEVLVEGNRVDLDSLLNALYRGPRTAQVNGVRTEWSPGTGEFRGFQVRMTST
ncbi:MAG: acylphosphatase [Anaerolineales bacterium]|jgi:acylphosphatase|nr:acylphosphatase [Anaerolineales bacterium]